MDLFVLIQRATILFAKTRVKGYIHFARPGPRGVLLDVRVIARGAIPA